ncbi:MAG: 50S ribosomal protein L24 [Candidatus Doudnabacteria bacterium RIFCSPHIGHO2_01_52_17]|uniref:Large ribosomal subunit protein uL24 n=1 Tax=Candidatus Doudnabacteria bacterium RIFCSPHIGHO2_01_52_17 TaxID=1817820 RepID=A0A1F5N8K6_9BACT|nr:ribosomal protein L24 [uncultured bacterium]KKW29780.1 MAG: 50S ribosomal protein L24 [Parcubacteria group bacterium GW2011_GWA2_52_8]OGE73923.1 MAG: 50S ribosomal protein L24 [Candidatus Doudnabacteria bacterium RIFCSPHIGHO2_01_52_17]
MFLRKGDTVKILRGKDRGKTGKIVFVSQEDSLATVEGAHLFWRHERPRKQGQKGQKVQLPRAVPVSNLMVICPHCHKPTRIGHQIDDKGVKGRICKNCRKRI